ncbi:hypothetical protein RchiOBHm_Chr4g0385561 [Rosa chinensis]|uniref:Uncharacterized protein n=1 Tax=Rosa chinensis TaxID=74649 RepID=A0A2P6QNZ9_ROSCH|nr:hypothetical protein RchiOBHm_Chr4g0385561 [Rosa chinensis]
MKSFLYNAQGFYEIKVVHKEPRHVSALICLVLSSDFDRHHTGLTLRVHQSLIEESNCTCHCLLVMQS